MGYLFTSESVSEGHPDKLCDRVSDTVLDLFLSAEPEARVACETFATTNRVVIGGEVRASEGKLAGILGSIEGAVRDAVADIGYEQEKFHHAHFEFQNYLHEQSTDIAMGVDISSNKDEGAGDQGLMFGYACRETDVLMPAPIHYSHQILKRLAEIRKADQDSILGPDSKSQITLLYDDEGRPQRAQKIVLSTQHDADASQSDIRKLVTPVIADILPEGWMVGEDDLLVNPTGNFVIGGPDGDAGLTGRKIIVDTYGGAAPHGGGAFSGKDPTKVDRSAAYAARYLAKNVVAAGLADRCTIQIAYAIGVAEPVSLYADTHGTGKVEDSRLEAALTETMALTPRNIREHLGLNRPIYAPTSAYGHFGRTAGEAGEGTFSWEAVDLAETLAAAV
ncbi:MAG: methionine adenosyltransferase [Pseudomonadota bacterium]|nr:methionine adenosyltransferase [Pseudomonadota bacterium]MEC8129291.1 methionine adenosyltransferase [Pseudomonadota bacterium]MED5313491.1 methionine adenosyltransferase [Pseudomonadota bacterium]MEE3024908.1 methionine adenosyltransferase [Pseudomonadota bacterium]